MAGSDARARQRSRHDVGLAGAGANARPMVIGNAAAPAHSALLRTRAGATVLCARCRSGCPNRNGGRDAVRHWLQEWPDAIVGAVSAELSGLVVLQRVVTWKRACCRPPLDDPEVARVVHRTARLHRRGHGADLP